MVILAIMVQRSLAEDLEEGLRSATLYLSWAALVAILTLAAPFQDALGLSTLGRAVFWSAVVALALVWGLLLRIGLERRFARLGRRRAVLLGSAISALVLSCPIRCLAIPLVPSGGRPLPGLAFFALVIFSAGLAVGLLRMVLDPLQAQARRLPAEGGAKDPADPEAQDGTAVADPRLYLRLAPGPHGPLIRLSVDDHYVNVHTASGVQSVLLRLTDAIAETEGIAGLKVHRSHWVAQAAVRGARRAGGRWLLQMADGAEVPVSRAYLPDVAASGLISGWDTAAVARRIANPSTAAMAEPASTPSRTSFM